MLKDFFTDFIIAVDEVFTDITLSLIYPTQWKIAKKIASNGKKN